MARLLRGIGAALGLGGATYYGKIGYDVHDANREAERIELQHSALTAAVVEDEARLKQDEALIADMVATITRLEKRLVEWDVRVEDAESALRSLKDKRAADQEQAAGLVAGVNEAYVRVEESKLARVKHEENAQVALLALDEARHLVEETRRLYNPLNLPLVKSVLKQP